MTLEITVETPLQDDVRELGAELDPAFLGLTPPEFCLHVTAGQMTTLTGDRHPAAWAVHEHAGFRDAGQRSTIRTRNGPSSTASS